MLNSESAIAEASAGASIGKSGSVVEQANATGTYVATCYDADGNVKWVDTFDNLVTTAGKNDALDKYLSGSSYTAAWYIGLISSTSYGAGPAVGDTSASHAGWTEDVAYSQSTRPAAAFSSASAGSKALSSSLTFSMNGTTTIKGSFLISNSAKSGATGILYSAGLFVGGDKIVASGDTINVSYQANL